MYELLANQQLIELILERTCIQGSSIRWPVVDKAVPKPTREIDSQIQPQCLTEIFVPRPSNTAPEKQGDALETSAEIIPNVGQSLGDKPTVIYRTSECLSQ